MYLYLVIAMNLKMVYSNSGKSKRVSGLDAFRKQWYETRKLEKPEIKGLDSFNCIKDWKALTDAERAEWKEFRRQQIINTNV